LIEVNLQLTEDPYDGTKFQNRVVHFRLFDHHNPCVSVLVQIMETMERWLKADPSNVVAVHCLVPYRCSSKLIKRLEEEELGQLSPVS
jgi:hypothetical protein